MKRLFATDLHGRRDYVQTLAAMAGRHQPDLFIFGGDDLPSGDSAPPPVSHTRFMPEDLCTYLQKIHRNGPTTHITARRQP